MKDAKGHGSEKRGGAAGAYTPTRLTPPVRQAVAERVAMRRAVDERHYPTSTVTDRMAAMSLGQAHPKSYIAPLGSSFAQAQDQLDRARNLALPRGTPGRRK